MHDVQIKLTIDEVNYILAVLSKQPYEDVVTLISKIKNQGDEFLRTSSQFKDIPE